MHMQAVFAMRGSIHSAREDDHILWKCFLQPPPHFLLTRTLELDEPRPVANEGVKCEAILRHIFYIYKSMMGIV